MHIRLERLATPEVPTELVEVVTPRTNTATLTAAEHVLAALALPARRSEPFALEVAATHQGRWFLVRAAGPQMRRRLEEQLGAAYPQAELRPLDLARFPGLDPARPHDGEQVAAGVLPLGQPPCLPLRTFRDQELAADPQADPVLGLLAALGDLPAGWRALAQLVCLRPAPQDWARGYLRLALEHPLAAERAAGRQTTSLTSVVLMGGLLLTGTAALQGLQWYADGAWLPLGLLAAGGALGVPAAVWLARRLLRRPLYDPRLVQEKLGRSAFLTQLRLVIFAPAEAPRASVEERLQRLAAAYGPFALPSGNFFSARPRPLRHGDLRSLAPLPPKRSVAVLNVRELAGLWHLPQAGADVPLLERTTARHHLPLPPSVARGCAIGAATYQGRTVPVALSPELLRRHLLLVVKTRRGKSSLLLHLVRHLMDAPRGTHALILVDPHGDLARAALGLVPPHRSQDVVVLDLAQQERPFGLNLLDVGLGWDRDQATSNALMVFRREFDRFWGPRMEDAFRFALLTLLEANQAICAAGPDGRSRQYTLLQVPALLSSPPFRRQVLGLVQDPVVHHWWADYFDALDRRLQVEVINPVQTKVQRFAASRAARSVVGQPCSTIDPGAWLREGAIVVVHTAKGVVGEDTAALVGGALLNLAALAVGRQAMLPPEERRAVTFAVDEFHTVPGADYEGILSELAKYGANLVLATQSLARLEALDREHGRALRATVFANLDGLFAFHSSAEDARYLVHELGEEVDEQDLVSLGEHQCYARLSGGGERLRVFWVRLDPPPAGDAVLAERLAAGSAARYGRSAAVVEAELAAAVARVTQARQGSASVQAGQAEAGVPVDPGGADLPQAEERPPHRGGWGKKAGKGEKRAQERQAQPSTRQRGRRNRERDEQGRLTLDAGDGPGVARFPQPQVGDRRPSAGERHEDEEGVEA